MTDATRQTNDPDLADFILDTEDEYEVSGYELEEILPDNLQFKVEHKLCWTDEATKLLLELYKEKIVLLNSNKIKSKKRLWQQIANEMTEQNFEVTYIQVENKFKSLERAYKNMKVNNSKGRGKTTCPYQKEMANILGNKHDVEFVDFADESYIKEVKPELPFSGSSLESLIEQMRKDNSHRLKFERGLLDEYKKIRESNEAQMGRIEKQLAISNKLRKETNDLLKTLIKQGSS